MRVRFIENRNYFALFTGETTIRFSINDNAPVEQLPLFNAEMYDISINNKCAGGCDYCYISALPTGHNYDNIFYKFDQLFGKYDDIPVSSDQNLTDLTVQALETYLGAPIDKFIRLGYINLDKIMFTHKPFQIAIGGAGEPTMHPQFVEFLKFVRSLDIVPNFTTNGMKVTDDILDVCDTDVGGVSVTLHAHLEKYWRNALKEYQQTSAKLHAHIVVYNESDIFLIQKHVEEYPDITFVLLPFQHVGFGENYSKQDLAFYDKLFQMIVDNNYQQHIAYGAGFHHYLVEHNIVNASLYPPHAYSYYLDLDNGCSIYKTSFDWQTPLVTGFIT